MSKLILKRFHCVTETDEVGADSPYFLTFVGDIVSGQTALRLTRQGNWHNEVDQGEIWQVNATVADGFEFKPGRTLVLCAMVEEDEGLDISGAEVESMLAAMTQRLNQYRATGANVVKPIITNGMAQLMRSLIFVSTLSSAGAQDDIVGVKALALNGNNGEQALVSLVGDGGHYRVRYAVA